MGQDSLDQLYGDHLAAMTRRAERALQAGGFDALVVHSGVAPMQFLDDQAYPYKVNPHFKAWVPIVDNAHCVLIVAPGNRPKLLFYRPDDFWHKPAEVPQAPWTAAIDVVPIDTPARGAAHWATLGRPALIGPPSAFEGADPAAINPQELLQLLHHERAVKTPYELECLRRANLLGACGHLAALQAFREGASEFTIHMRYLQACAQREEDLPYNSIVAYNEHAAILHYQHLERESPRPAHSLLIDAGAQYRGYASDITRSYAASAGPYADLVAGLDEAQQRLCLEIVAGRDYREVHLAAHRILGDLLHRFGLTKVPGQEALERGITGVFFPHGIGHLLGLQVHDVGGVIAERPAGHPYLRLTRRLEPGVVVTVEPGIYLIDSLLAAAHASPKRDAIDWPMVEALRPCGGIRIEDDVATTAGTPENLTRDAFARLAA